MGEVPPEAPKPDPIGNPDGNLFDQAGEIFLSVRELGISSRDEAVDRACAGNDELRKIVQLLLRGDDAPLPMESLADDIRAAHDAVPTFESAVSTATSDRIGHYKLLERIGEGGFGIVFMADQERPVRRRVALKIIKLGMDTRQVVARFEAERQALALMDHPSIAKVLDAGATETGRPYFVMELVKGQPITEFCDMHKLSVSKRLELISQVCDALQHAHQRGVIHRDIKPSNVLVAGTPDKPLCKIIDFGIAKATSARLTDKTIFTEFRHMIGTPEYMSPEQAGESRQDVDTRTDVYATGVLMYELLTGSTPLDSKRLRSAAYGEVQRIIREEDPPTPSTKLSGNASTLATVAHLRSVPSTKLTGVVKGELDWIVMKAIDKDRARRYDSAGSLLEDIQRYLGGEAVRAAPPGAAYVAKKFVKRHRGPVIAIGLLAFTLITGLIGTSLGFINAESQRQDAVREKKRADDKAVEAERNAAAERQARLDLEYQSYVANILSASALLDNHAPGLAVPLLSKCPTRLRGWEWRWLSASADTSLAVLRGHTTPVRGLSTSGDGSRLVTFGENDHVARIWNMLTREEIAKVGDKEGALTCAILSPDGSRVVTASNAGTIRIFGVNDGKSIFKMKGHSESVTRAIFSPDARFVAAASSDTTASIWDAQTGKLLRKLEGHSAPIQWISYSFDGESVVTASEDGTARIWNAATGEVRFVLRGHSGWTMQAEFSRDGTKVAVRAWGPSRVWNAKTGEPISQLSGFSNLAASIAFSHDGTQVLMAGMDGQVFVYDADTGRILLTLNGHQHRVNSAVFSPDGSMIITASDDRTVIIWDAKTGARIGDLIGHSGGVESAACTPDGTHIVTISKDQSIRIWDARPAGAVSIIRHDGSAIFFSDFSPDSTRIVLAMDTREAVVYSALTGQKLTELIGHSNTVWSAAFSPDGVRVVTGSFDKTARVWDASTGRELMTLSGHTDFVVKARYNHAGNRIATVSHDGSLKVWDAENGSCLLTVPAHDGWVLDVKFSPDDTTILTASADCTAKLWNAVTGELVRIYRAHAQACASAAFSPDGKRILTGSRDYTIKMWDCATGILLSTPVQRSDCVVSASFSRDSTRLLASLNEGTAILMDAETSTLLAEFKGHNDHVITATFSPDESMMLTTSKDGSARIWHSIPYRDRLPRIQKARDALSGH